MKPSPIIQTAWHLLDLILQEEPPSDAALAQALDELALAYHQVPEGLWASSDIAPPKRDNVAVRAIISARFPDHGYYVCAIDQLDLSQEKVGTGDALDDLVDIVGDLAEAVWRFDHLGPDDAHRYLHQGHAHWGRHMRDLSLYLHARRFG